MYDLVRYHCVFDGVIGGTEVSLDCLREYLQENIAFTLKPVRFLKLSWQIAKDSHCKMWSVIKSFPLTGFSCLGRSLWLFTQRVCKYLQEDSLKLAMPVIFQLIIGDVGLPTRKPFVVSPFPTNIRLSQWGQVAGWWLVGPI